MRAPILSAVVFLLPLAACGPKVTPEQKAEAITAFATVQKVFQHPRRPECGSSGSAGVGRPSARWRRQ